MQERDLLKDFQKDLQRDCNRLDELQTDFQIGLVKAKVDLYFLRV